MVQVFGDAEEASQPILQDHFHHKPVSSSATLQHNAEEAYRDLARSLQTDPLNNENFIVALNLYPTAVRIQNLPLAIQCTEIMRHHLNVDKKNALRILSHVSQHKQTQHNSHFVDFTPSAPIFDEDDLHENRSDHLKFLTKDLVSSCLCEIDRQGDFMLKQKEIVELSYGDLLNVTTRDSLQVSDEVIVYGAIMRWAREEFRRRGLDASDIGLSHVLQELKYAPRYGLMTKKDFESRTIDGMLGPTRSGILSNTEINNILRYIRKSKTKPPEQLPKLPYKASQPRKLSTPNAIGQKFGRKTTCDKWVINFLTCWTAVFD